MRVIFLMKQLISYGKKLTSNAISEEAVVTEHAKIFVRYMLYETCDKLFRGEGKIAISICHMI